MPSRHSLPGRGVEQVRPQLVRGDARSVGNGSDALGWHAPAYPAQDSGRRHVKLTAQSREPTALRNMLLQGHAEFLLYAEKPVKRFFPDRAKAPSARLR